MAGAGGVYCYMCHAFTCCFKAEADELISLAAEAELLGGGAGDGGGAVGLDGNGGFLNSVFHCKHVDGHLNLFSVSKDAGKGGDNHQRVLDDDCFFCVAVCAVMGCNKHYAHAAHIHGKFQFQNIRSFSLESSGLQEQDGRIEAVVLAGAGYGVFVTAYCRQRGKFCAVCSNNLIIEVPGFYAKGFRFVHPAPGIRRFESG